MDAFAVAFKIPNLLRRFFAEGAFSQAFVPVIAEYRTLGSHADTRELVARVSGTNACEKAPSAKKRRSRFGILKATANASMTTLEPNNPDSTMSRARPVMRDSRVMLPTTAVLVSKRSLCSRRGSPLGCNVMRSGLCA
jgi:hypothetical protein